MSNALSLDAIAAVWLFGALILWPIARAIDARARLGLRLLKWAFLVQLVLQALWGGWLAILWARDVPHIEHGLIPLYVIGSVGWIVSALAFVYWLIERRKPIRAK